MRHNLKEESSGLKYFAHLHYVLEVNFKAAIKCTVGTMTSLTTNCGGMEMLVL